MKHARKPEKLGTSYLKRKNHHVIPSVFIAFMISAIVGCSNSDDSKIKGSAAALPVTASKSTLDPVSHSNIQHNAKVKTAVHKVIYKEGEYPIKPSWMTQRQWNSYIDWEGGRMTKRETPRWDEDAKLVKLLRRKFGSRLREASTSKGSDQNDPVPGWVAEVDIYSNRSEATANAYVTEVCEAIFASNLGVDRVIVNICLHEEPIDGTIYSVQVDKGQEPKIVLEFDPTG